MLNYYKQKNLVELEKILNIEFINKKLLRRAVTHKSFPNENPNLNLKNNERMEFLGDAVLDLSMSSYLFKKFPNKPEGKLAKMKAILVSAPILAEIAKKININRFLLLGKGEEMTGGRNRDSILADTLEAIIGAIYLDQGLEAADKFIIENFDEDIQSVQKGDHIRDYKTLLQETIQKNSNKRPEYYVADEEGPDHNKTFIVKVEFNESILGFGKGTSKKDAEQKAAKAALENLDEI
ncbi:MAG: ribonuclease III [Halanaerobiales bacterium]